MVTTVHSGDLQLGDTHSLKPHVGLTSHKLNPHSEVGPTSLHSQQPDTAFSPQPTFLLPILQVSSGSTAWASEHKCREDGYG